MLKVIIDKPTIQQNSPLFKDALKDAKPEEVNLMFEEVCMQLIEENNDAEVQISALNSENDKLKNQIQDLQP